jgi:hypothetical protein
MSGFSDLAFAVGRRLLATAMALAMAGVLPAQVPTQRDSLAPRERSPLESALFNRARQSSARRDSSRALAIVRAIPLRASIDTVERALPRLIAAIGSSRRADMPLVREALAQLRRRTNAVAAITRSLDRAERSNFVWRRSLLEVLGELQRPDAFPVLRTIAWAPLPDREKGAGERTTARDHEEMLQSVAVRGLAFIRTDAGEVIPSVNDEVIKLAVEHPSLVVRIAAVDAFLWNHGDSPAARARLQEALPREMHGYITRPRLQRSLDPEAFGRATRQRRDSQ